ncbi:MAG: hypothetical protein GTO18_15225 [Anaerolineales bacterium]|nr:hypothetical protein [Anaerolineales bacterium]
MFKALRNVLREATQEDIDKKLRALLFEGRDYDDHILLQDPREVAVLFKKYPFILGYFFTPDVVAEIAENLPTTQESYSLTYEEWMKLSLVWRKQAYIGYFCPPKDYDRFTLIECQTRLFKLLFTLALSEAIKQGFITKEQAIKPDIYERSKALASS